MKYLCWLSVRNPVSAGIRNAKNSENSLQSTTNAEMHFILTNLYYKAISLIHLYDEQFEEAQEEDSKDLMFARRLNFA